MKKNLLKQLQILRDTNERQAYFIAKELALIELNLLWYQDKIDNNIDRLYSLVDHINLTFKNNRTATSLRNEIKSIADELTSYKSSLDD